MRNVLIIILSSISVLSGCASSIGNVIPATGPTMEHVYDGMNIMPRAKQSLRPVTRSASAICKKEYFHAIPNPALEMYVHPHISGTEGLPIPGYYTVFNA